MSSYFATSYATVRLCVEAVAADAVSDDPSAVRDALAGPRHRHACSGRWRSIRDTNHAALPFHLGRIAGDGFDILQSRAELAADPYLIGRPRGPRRVAPPSRS